MLCSAKSEYGWMVWLPSAGPNLFGAVTRVGVWQNAQPMLTNWLEPCTTVLSIGPRAGGDRKRMNEANPVTSSNWPVPVALRSKVSLGEGTGEQNRVSSRSFGKTRLVMPISTL